MKSSLHWTLGHVADLIELNDGYSLAEVSENSFENWIKTYRHTTENHARQTSMQDNNSDSLRNMWLYSRQDVRKFDKNPKQSKVDNHLTQKINDFFEVSEDGQKWSFQEEESFSKQHSQNFMYL